MANPSMSFAITVKDDGTASIEKFGKNLKDLQKPADIFANSMKNLGDSSSMQRLSEGMASLSASSLGSVVMLRCRSPQGAPKRRP
jgi:hypothetical protein